MYSPATMQTEGRTKARKKTGTLSRELKQLGKDSSIRAMDAVKIQQRRREQAERDRMEIWGCPIEQVRHEPRTTVDTTGVSLFRRNTAKDCIRLTIGKTRAGSSGGDLSQARNIAIDSATSRAFVVSGKGHCVKVFSLIDGSFIFKIGRRGQGPNRFFYPIGVTIDHERGLLFVSSAGSHDVQVFSLSTYENIAHAGEDKFFSAPVAIQYDTEHQRLLVGNSAVLDHTLEGFDHNGLRCFRLSLAKKYSFWPAGLAIDTKHHRLLIIDESSHAIMVCTLRSGAIEFEFGKMGTGAGEFTGPMAVCVDHLGRIIVADRTNKCLQAFLPDGTLLSIFDWPEEVWGVAFDEPHGWIVFTARHQIHVIEANAWLPNTFLWKPDRHKFAPRSVRRAVEVITMMRTLVADSPFALLPDNILFDGIFAWLS